MAADAQVAVLLVEDDDAIGGTIVRGLGTHGFRVRWETTAAAAIAAAKAHEPDVVLLDLGLPDLDGLELCRRLRRHYAGPLIVVSARDTEDDRVLGLEVGADDYVVKPVGLRELAARIHAVQRRGTHALRRTLVQRGPLVVDRDTHAASLDGRPLDLTPTEFALVLELASADGAVVPRDELVRQVWGRAWRGDSKTVDVHVAAIRRKLGDPGWVRAVRGVGLVLAPPREDRNPPATP